MSFPFLAGSSRLAAFLFAASLSHALPAATGPAGPLADPGEDECLHSLGYGGSSQDTSHAHVARPVATGNPGERMLVCSADSARSNASFPLKSTVDYVPITGDDSLGFYVVYSARLDATGTAISNNVGIFLFPLNNGEVLVFGSGYGNIPGVNANDAAFDMGRVDTVIQACMGRTPATTPLRIVAPHGHGDHINPACHTALRNLGYSIVEVAFHEGDLALVNGMAWTQQDRDLFHVLSTGATCQSEILGYDSPLGRIWFHHRPGHTDGSIDCIIDVKGDATNRFLVRGSQPGAGCATIPGVREIVNAHGNSVLTAPLPTFTSLAPTTGTALGGTAVTVTGSGFQAAGAGRAEVLFDGVPATNAVTVSDTEITCTTPAGVAGNSVLVEVVTYNGRSQAQGTFDYLAAPTLTGVSPATGDWRGGNTVVITGSGFTGAGPNEVFFGASRATGVTVQNAGQLACRVPAGIPGTTVTISLRNGNGQTSLPGGYTYQADFVIVDVAPLSGTALGGTDVTLSGFAFTGDGNPPTVTFDGVAATNVALVSDTTVTCTVPPGVPGTSVQVSLTNSVGTTNFNSFRYHARPTLTGLSPSSGPALGGTTVTIDGTGFLADAPGTNVVTFGGAAAGNVAVLSDTRLTCSAPAGTNGSIADVVLANANGSDSLVGAWRFGQMLVVDAIAPGSGTSLGGTPVTLTGSGFLDGPAGPTTVLVGGVDASSSVTVIDDATLTFDAPAGTPGSTVDVDVSNTNGTVRLPGAFRYHARPVVASVTPSSGHADEATPVTITGSGFLVDEAGPGFVVFGGFTATDVTVVDDTTLVCVAPPGSAGTVTDVIFANQNGQAQLPGGFRYHAAPQVVSLSPASGPGAGGDRITVTGAGFLDDQAGTNVVAFGTQPAPAVSVISDTTLRVDVPPGTAGTRVDVRVSNARGTNTLVQGYRYHARPAVTRVAPERGTFLGGTVVTLTGTGFQIDAPGTNQVTFGGVAATGVTVVDDTTLTCLTPPGALDATVDVVLANRNGSVTIPAAFSYSVPAPTLVTLTPASGPSTGGATITLSGSGFLDNAAGASTVTFGAAVSPSVVVVSDTRLDCQVPPGPAGTVVDVVVTNANGTGTLALGYRYHAAPAIASVAPAGASALGGTPLTITGSGFLADAAGANQVLFDGTPATDVGVVSDTVLACTAPAGTPGPVTLVVTNDNGDSSAFAFSFNPFPTLAVVDPPFGPAFGGGTLALTGTGFLDNGVQRNEVRIGGKLSSAVTVVSDTRIECMVPRGSPGFVDVRVTNENGSVLLPNGYHYGKLPPTVVAMTPDHGSALGGLTVTIDGAGFVDNGAGVNRVDFGGVLAGDVVVLDDSRLVCTTPRQVAGSTVPVTVSNNNGSALVTPSFRVHPAPVLAGIGPAGGKAFGGETVTLTGTGFHSDGAGQNTVRFGTVPAREVVVVSDTQLTCRAPGGTAGARLDVTLRNANGITTLPEAWTIAGGPPTLARVVPDSGLFAGGDTIELVGRGFAEPEAGRLRVWFGGTQATDVTVIDDQHATCTAPAGPVNTTVPVMVQNRNGASTQVDAFTFVSIPPRLFALAPDHGSALGGTALQLTGESFLAIGGGTPTVTFDGVPATSVVVVDDTTVTCRTPAGTSAAAAEVRLENQNGGADAVLTFRYHALPTLAGVGVQHGPAGGGTPTTLTGTGFVADDAGACTVTFDGVAAANVVVVDDSTITCQSPAGAGGTLADVRVANANGGATLSEAFRYHALPAITTVTPARGSAAGGTIVTILGSGFSDDQAGANTITFGGAPAIGVTILDDQTLACLTPAGTSGSDADVVVRNANGSATAAGAFHYHPEITLTGITPARGPESGGTAVTLTGSSFLADGAGPALVTFGGLTAVDVVVVDDATITCTAPAGKAGQTVDVMVANAHGDVTLVAAFLYHGTPQIASLSPADGPAPGGTAVVLTGRGFTADQAGPSTVTFDGVAAADVVAIDDATITCTAPAGTPGATVDVEVSNANGTSLLTAAFRYHVLPTLASVTPARGPSEGGTIVTVTGTGFSDDDAGAATVTFDGVHATGVSILDDGTLSCTTPAGTPLADAEVVLENANGTASLAAAFHYHPTVRVTALDRTRGPEIGGTAVTLTGTGFLDDGAGPALVAFGGLTASDVVVVDDATITCTSPGGVAGQTVDVMVANAHGLGTLPGAFLYHGVPQLASLTPDHGSALGGAAVTLTGRGFVVDLAGTNVVTFGGVAATDVVAVDDATITCRAPAGTPAAVVDVVVTNDNGTSSLAAAFRLHARPTLTGLSSPRGPSGGGSTVTVLGSGFSADGAGTNTVLFGGIPATAVTVVDDGTLSCQVPPGAPATTVALDLSNANGAATLGDAFRYNPLPTVTAVTPAAGSPLGGEVVTVNGSGFFDFTPGATSVTFGALDATGIAVLDDTTLTCVTPAGTGGATVDLVVSNRNGKDTLPGGFTYHPAPTLTALAPTSGPAAGGGLLTLTGSGFSASSPASTFVTFGGVASFNVTVVDDTTATCDVPPGTPGTSVDVALVNENGIATKVAGYRYHARPTLAAIDPPTGLSVAPTPVTLTGTGFQVDQAGPNAVLFGALAATDVIVVDDATLTCTAPAAPAGSSVTVQVSNANGVATLDGFAYAAPAPTLAALTPASGTSEGGTTVTLTGTNFQAPAAGATLVTFGGAAATDVTVVDDGTVTCTTPPGTVDQTVDVVLANDNGSATLAGAFTWTAPAPVLTAVAPDHGAAISTTPVTLTGTGFQAFAAGPNAVTFGGAAATSVVVQSDTQLTCEAPPGTPGALVDVAVTNANGTALRAGGFRYHATPTLATVTPGSGTSLGGTLVTVKGTGFLADDAGPNTVRFGSASATSITIVNDTTMTCRVPAGASGATVDLTVANANGQTVLAGGWRYHARPVLTGVASSSGPASGGTRVTLTGSGFRTDGAVVNIVSFGGLVASSVTVVDDTTIQCNTPAGTAGNAVQVTVANVNGTAILPGGFRYHPRPTLAAVAPSSGPETGGTAVTLTGTGFLNDSAGTNAVTFGGAPASAVTVVSDVEITCTTPPGTAGALVDVVLSNANGSVTRVGGYQYDAGAAPLVAGVTPAKGSTQGQTPVTIVGAGFDPGGSTTVRFGADAATDVVVLDEGTIVCRTPAGAGSAWVDVSVAQASGGSSLQRGFQFVAPPGLSAIEPPVGTPDGGALVTLTGSGFLDGEPGENLVLFGDRPAPFVYVVSDDLLVCETPAGELLGRTDVEVRNDNGSATLTDGFRWQLALSTDLNRDGRGDLVVATPGHDEGTADVGAVHVFFGSALPALDRSTTDADVVAVSETAQAGFGAPVVTGDVDGDGIADLLVAAPLHDGAGTDAGAVFLFRGPLSASGLPLSTTGATVLTGQVAGERFGSALCLADVDRDGILDALVGAPGGDTGRVDLFLGSPLGLARTPSTSLASPASGDAFATHLAAGDLDGDGWAEIVVGAPRGEGSVLGLVTGTAGLGAPGVVHVFRGGPLAAHANAPEVWISFSGTVPGAGFGSALAVRDLDGDAFDDLAVAAPSGPTGGQVLVFRGSPERDGASDLTADARLASEDPEARFGAALAAGDVDGDGLSDLLVGAPGTLPGGRAYLFLGGPASDRSSAQADLALDPEAIDGSSFGGTVALVDVDGDGLEDMVVTAPTLDAAVARAGRVYVFRGTNVLEGRQASNDDGTLTGAHPGDRLGEAAPSDR